MAVSMTVPNVYREPEVATNMTLPFHWDALIVNDLYKNFLSQVSIWASLNVSKNTNFPISSNVSNSGNFPATFSYNTVRSVRFNLMQFCDLGEFLWYGKFFWNEYIMGLASWMLPCKILMFSYFDVCHESLISMEKLNCKPIIVSAKC